MVRELCKYRFRAAFGVWALWCGGAPFGRFPSRLRRRGAHLGGGGEAVGGQVRVAAQGGVRLCLHPPPPCARHFGHQRAGRGSRQVATGRTHGQGRGWSAALPPLRTVIRHTSGQGRGRRQVTAGRAHGQGRGWPGALPPLRTVIRHTSGQGRGRRQAAAGRTHGQGRGWPGALPPLRTVIRHTSGMVRHCARGRPPLPSPSPTLRTAARATVAQRRGLFPGAARTLPGSGRRANDILYIRVRRRESENVLHRAASNDVDNFSVDNPLWITAAAGGRLLRGGRGRRCGGSVNAGTPFRSQGCDFTTWTGGRIYNNTRARELLRRKCVKPADLTTHSPPKICSRPSTATHPSRALPPPHAAQTHTRRPHNPFPTEDLPSPPHSDTPFPSTSAPPRSPDARPQAARCTPAGCTMHARSAQCIPRCPHNSFPAENLRTPTHSDTPSPSTSYRPLSPNARPQAARCIPRRPHNTFPAATRCLPFHSASGTKKRHRTVHVRCRMSRSTVVAVGHWGW